MDLQNKRLLQTGYAKNFEDVDKMDKLLGKCSFINL